MALTRRSASDPRLSLTIDALLGSVPMTTHGTSVTATPRGSRGLRQVRVKCFVAMG